MTRSDFVEHVDIGPKPAPAALTVSGLAVALRTGGRTIPVVTDVSLELHAGMTHGLVGESGSGKTLTSLAVMGVLPQVATVIAGSAHLGGQDLLALPSTELADVRGRKIAMIFQDAMRSLNPVFTVGEQIAEVARRHLKLSRRDAWNRAVDMLDRVAIREPRRRAHDYPSEFSGGMAQRAMIAMALVAEPSVLIADEPTTALDVTVQAQVLLLLRSLQKEFGLSVLFITHDLGVVAEMCDDVSVMYAGQVVESGAVGEVFTRPHHPYTSSLLASLPRPRHRTSTFGFIPGFVPAPQDWPAGCRFSPRCDHSVANLCDPQSPALTVVAGGHGARCARVAELTLPGIESS